MQSTANSHTTYELKTTGNRKLYVCNNNKEVITNLKPIFGSFTQKLECI